MHTTTSRPGGGKSHLIRFSTTLGEALAGWIVPNAVARMPTWGRVATTLVSWVPTALVALLAVGFDQRFLRPRVVTPGALPDVLAEAFRRTEPIAMPLVP